MYVVHPQSALPKKTENIREQMPRKKKKEGGGKLAIKISSLKILRGLGFV